MAAIVLRYRAIRNIHQRDSFRRVILAHRRSSRRRLHNGQSDGDLARRLLSYSRGLLLGSFDPLLGSDDEFVYWCQLNLFSRPGS